MLQIMGRSQKQETDGAMAIIFGPNNRLLRHKQTDTHFSQSLDGTIGSGLIQDNLSLGHLSIRSSTSEIKPSFHV